VIDNNKGTRLLDYRIYNGTKKFYDTGPRYVLQLFKVKIHKIANNLAATEAREK
jgi:hypothetical protein